MGPSQFRGDGTSVGFILLTAIAGSAQIYIRDMLAVIFPNNVLFNEKNFWIFAVVEFVFIFLPIEVSVTIFNVQSGHQLFVIVAILTAIFVVTISSYRENLPRAFGEFGQLRMSERRATVTYVRAFVNVIASLCILAVDFPIFPKYEIKSKHYGTTFMDGGVGIYVVAGAMVSAYSRNKKVQMRSILSSVAAFDFNPPKVEPLGKGQPILVFPWITEDDPLTQEVTDASIMVVLGLGRLILINITGYKVNEMEYGVHWNFFFTLAFIKVVSSLLQTSLPRHVTPVLGPIITLLYQLFLLIPPVYRFVMFGAKGHFSRTNFIDANREGIFSAIGYLALYFYGTELGRYLMKKRQTLAEWCKVCVVCFLLTFGSWLLFLLSTTYFDIASRQMANAAYIFFVLYLAGGTTSISMLFELATTFLSSVVRNTGHTYEATPYTECPVLRSINFNGLFYFLLANLLTGTINIVVDTREFTETASYIIVTGYLFVLSTLVLYLDRRKINVKEILVRRLLGRKTEFKANGKLPEV